MTLNFFKNKNLIIIILLIVCFVLAAFLGTLIYSQYSQAKEKTIEKEKVKTEETEGQGAAEKVLDYINKNFLKDSTKAELAGKIEEKQGLYSFKIKIGTEEFLAYVTKDKKLFFPQVIDLEKTPDQGLSKETKEEETTLGYFSVTKDEICKENDKPLIYFFGASGCPHCRWEHPVAERAMKKFEGLISFHNNMDSQADMEVFSKYSKGGIPTLVLGCRYYREGSGEMSGEETEIKNLTALVCKLTGNQPLKECEKVKELIEQIKN